MSLAVIVFNVGRGLCVAIQTPNNFLALIDCGTSDTFSPVKWLSDRKHLFQQRNGHVLTKLVVTHPHNDHIADIEQVTQLMPPSIIVRKTDLDWKRVLSGNPATQALKHYWEHYCPPHYCEDIPADQMPDWGDGMTLTHYSIPVATASKVSASDNSYVNNTSIISVVRYRNYTFAIFGDNETEGIDALLVAHPQLRAEVGKRPAIGGGVTSGVDFLIAPHHGHASAFSTNWFQLTGPTTKFNVVSERSAGQGEDASRVAVDPRYSAPEFSLAQNREGRRMVSTRSDGHIVLSVDQNGQWSWQGIS
jgi:beta-lactamase superfamily II metal-dependent hydrolase